MGLKQVKSEILEDARQKADKIVEEGEEERKEIIEDAEKEAEKIKKKFEDELEEEKEAYRKKAISNADMKAKKEKLRAKEEKLDEVFGKFRDEIKDLSDTEKESYVESCLQKVSFEPGKVIGSSNYSEFVDVDFEEANVQGIIIESEDGEKRQNFSLDKIVQRFKDKYRKKAAEKLFEGQ